MISSDFITELMTEIKGADAKHISTEAYSIYFAEFAEQAKIGDASQ